MDFPFILTLRWLAGFIAAAHIFGLVMFLSSNQLGSFLAPAGLLLISVRGQKIPFIAAAIGLLILGYITAGMSFLNPEVEVDVRLIHILELGLFVVISIAGIRRAIHGLVP